MSNAQQMEGCCSKDCIDVIHLPEEERKATRKGIKNGNKIFKKGKSDVLTFRNRATITEGKAMKTHKDSRQFLVTVAY
jgi:hypothetical protein